ncbi:MAG TPA: hypothetical protein VEY51_20925 [Chondromyces sp.]|nr:hypothetical protein [Chondromyces sp.]
MAGTGQADKAGSGEVVDKTPRQRERKKWQDGARVGRKVSNRAYMAKRKGEKEGMMKNGRGRQEAANHVPSVLLLVIGKPVDCRGKKARRRTRSGSGREVQPNQPGALVH